MDVDFFGGWRGGGMSLWTVYVSLYSYDHFEKKQVKSVFGIKTHHYLFHFKVKWEVLHFSRLKKKTQKMPCATLELIAFGLPILFPGAAFLRSVSCHLTWRTTSGRWVKLAHVAHVQKYTMIALEVGMPANWSTWMTQTSWRSGTWSSFSSTGTAVLCSHLHLNSLYTDACKKIFCMSQSD